MTEPQNDSVIQRLDRLERENRFWKKIAGALFILLTVLTTVVLIGSVKTTKTDEVLTADEIRTRRLVVMDEKGKPRISAKPRTQLGRTSLS